MRRLLQVIEDAVADYGPAVAVVLAVALVILAGVTAAGAQPVPVAGTWVVEITPGADNALITTYEVGYFAVGAADPIQAQAVPKAQWTTAGAGLRTPFPRLLFGVFEIRARGCAPSHPSGVACSSWVLAVPDGSSPTDRRVAVSPFPVNAARVGQ